MVSLVEISSVVLEGRFLKIWSKQFHNFLIISPSKKWGLHLYKLESTLPKDASWQVWLKLAQWFWRRRFLNFVNIFLLFCYYLPLGKGIVLCWTNLNPLHPRMLCTKFDLNWHSGSGEEEENVKSLTTMTTDNGQIVIRKAHLIAIGSFISITKQLTFTLEDRLYNLKDVLVSPNM